MFVVRECEGCGAMESWNTAVAFHPSKVEHRVCASKSNSGCLPKKSCLEKLRGKLRGCPGCRTRLTPEEYEARVLCGTCRAIIDRERESPQTPMVWGIVNSRNLLGDLVFDDRDENGEPTAARLLVALPELLKAALGDRQSRRGEPSVNLNQCPPERAIERVELPEGRVPAVRAFFAATSTVGDALHW